ncbi:uncharacterized protein LOC119070238 [Bradysia coprophila]|uniref:uncharacterized protein LOC119070238 n=1 Tax=Bradysia coprophila TaxID=38358 RepID=UPI00187D860E|nr:uncharacterized protein LOC119070238 [Bradysia coprophila]
MVLQCCVRGCETVGKSGFHSFPTNKVSAERWIVATKSHHLIDRLAANKLSNSFYKVCRKHFADTDFTKNGKGQIIIKQESTPSLFLPDGFPVHLPTRMSEKPVNTEERSHLPINDTSMNQSRTDSDIVDDDNYIDVEGLSSEEEVREKTGQKRTKCSKETVCGLIGFRGQSTFYVFCFVLCSSCML